MAWTTFTRPQHGRSKLCYTSNYNGQGICACGRPLAATVPAGRPRSTCLRSVLNAIFYVLQNGCTWANLPKDFPSSSTVYRYFLRFMQDGTWRRLHDVLYADCRDLEGHDVQPTLVTIDSQSVKCGCQAHEDKGFDDAKKSTDANAIWQPIALA